MSQSGFGKSDNQRGCEEELLHDESPLVAFETKRSNRLAMTPSET